MLTRGFIALLLFSCSVSTMAEITNSSQFLRIRIGTNNGTINTVEYEPGLPPFLTAIGGGVSEAETISTNRIAGGTAVFTVRIVTDVSFRNPFIAPVTGTYTYNSATPMLCSTPASCGAEVIPMTKISWRPSDNDTLNTITRYDGGANQEFQEQTDFNPANFGSNNRHRNRYQFRYTNDVLYPAGTYFGTVVLTGTAM